MTKVIHLPSGEPVLIDDQDLQKVSQFRWHKHIGYACASVPARFIQQFPMKRLRMHRLILDAEEGDIVDHKNRNRLDNRRCNLRFCSKGENAFNRRKALGKASRFKGVTWHQGKRRWQARITWKNADRFLGYFADEQDAGTVYNVAAQLLFGDFAHLNRI